MANIDSRLASAWQEISARIQTRERAFLTYILLIPTLLAISYNSNLRNAEILLSVGYISLAIALLLRHHDLIIGHLAFYQRQLEDYDQRTNKNVLPAWQSPELRVKVRKARNIRDFTQAIFIGLGSVSSLFITFERCVSIIQAYLWFGSLICTLAAFYTIILTQMQRKAMWESKIS